MSKLYITEYSRTKNVEGNGNQPIIDEESLIQEQVLDFSGGEAKKTLHASTVIVRLNNDAICSVKYGVNGASPTATTSNRRMPADTVESFGVKGGAIYSAIANT